MLTSLANDKIRQRRSESLAAALVIDQTIRRQGPFKTMDRGVKTANFRVLFNYNMPSVLVECGFVDNMQDLAGLIQPKVQDQIAALLFNAINLYFAQSDPEFQAHLAPVGNS